MGKEYSKSNFNPNFDQEKFSLMELINRGGLQTVNYMYCKDASFASILSSQIQGGYGQFYDINTYGLTSVLIKSVDIKTNTIEGNHATFRDAVDSRKGVGKFQHMFISDDLTVGPRIDGGLSETVFKGNITQRGEHTIIELDGIGDIQGRFGVRSTTAEFGVKLSFDVGSTTMAFVAGFSATMVAPRIGMTGNLFVNKIIPDTFSLLETIYLNSPVKIDIRSKLITIAEVDNSLNPLNPNNISNYIQLKSKGLNAGLPDLNATIDINSSSTVNIQTANPQNKGHIFIGFEDPKDRTHDINIAATTTINMGAGETINIGNAEERAPEESTKILNINIDDAITIAGTEASQENLSIYIGKNQASEINIVSNLKLAQAGVEISFHGSNKFEEEAHPPPCYFSVGRFANDDNRPYSDIDYVDLYGGKHISLTTPLPAKNGQIYIGGDPTSIDKQLTKSATEVVSIQSNNKMELFAGKDLYLTVPRNNDGIGVNEIIIGGKNTQDFESVNHVMIVSSSITDILARNTLTLNTTDETAKNGDINIGGIVNIQKGGGLIKTSNTKNINIITTRTTVNNKLYFDSSDFLVDSTTITLGDASANSTTKLIAKPRSSFEVITPTIDFNIDTLFNTYAKVIKMNSDGNITIDGKNVFTIHTQVIGITSDNSLSLTAFAVGGAPPSDGQLLFSSSGKTSFTNSSSFSVTTTGPLELNANNLTLNNVKADFKVSIETTDTITADGTIASLKGSISAANNVSGTNIVASDNMECRTIKFGNVLFRSSLGVANVNYTWPAGEYIWPSGNYTWPGPPTLLTPEIPAGLTIRCFTAIGGFVQLTTFPTPTTGGYVVGPFISCDLLGNIDTNKIEIIPPLPVGTTKRFKVGPILTMPGVTNLLWQYNMIRVVGTIPVASFDEGSMDKYLYPEGTEGWIDQRDVINYPVFEEDKEGDNNDGN